MCKRHRWLAQGVDVEFQSVGRWQKSSYSGAGEECVEIRRDAVIAVRDSKSPDRRHLTYTTASWAAFVRAVHHHPNYAKACAMSDASECSSFQNASK
ncbi:DUF397 domain-containing protein [Streptomyces chartreusis]|uniref:DUF397 domain-containing protein n=1 Tax=Streptomyces chartreusis TaxID=1969 RepID=UPI0036CFD441